MDVTSLYAYADPSHMRDRELWRGFLSSILPLVLRQNSDAIDQMIVDSLVNSIDDLAIADDLSKMHSQQPIRLISTHIAKAIGVAPEFALASFYNSEYSDQMPTKLYRFHSKSLPKKTLVSQEDIMVSDWLENFYKIQNDRQFILDVEAWKDWFK